MERKDNNPLNLWWIFDEYRANSRLTSIADILQEYKSSHEVNFTWEMFASISIPQQDFTIPISIIRFFLAYLKKSEHKNFLIPFSGIGTLPVALISEGVVKEGTCIEANQDSIKMTNLIMGNNNIKMIQGYPWYVLPELGDRFDLAISCPPIGLKLHSSTIQLASLPKSVSISDPYLTVYFSLTKLSESGEGIFILPRSFPRSFQARSVKIIEDLGFFVNTIIDLPERLFQIGNRFPVSIFFISRHQTENVYVSILDLDKSPDELIEDIYSHRIEGKVVAGRQIDISEYRSWDMLLLNEEIILETKHSGIDSVHLGEISISINKGKQKIRSGGLQEEPNTIYIPVIGKSHVVTKLSNLNLKPHNYYQITLGETKAFAEYVAGFLNSPLGLKIRKLSEAGETISQIPLANLDQIKILLPSLDKQIEIINLENDIQTLNVNLATMEKSLWAKPGNVARLKRELRLFNRQSQELLNEWIDGLPFPLASILRRYQSTSEARDKVDHLLHFFEAYAEFNTSYLLSVYDQDEKIFQAQKNVWIDSENDFLKRKRASFGNWVVIGERIAKFARAQLSDPKTKSEVLGFFHTEIVDFINLVTHKDLYQVFRNVNNNRNDWSGHGGVANETEYKRRLALLETELTRIRELVKDSFSDFILVQPKSMVFSKGIYLNKIRSIMGSNPLFTETGLETNIALDKDELYLIEKNRRDPLKLLPFFRMLSSPQAESNACYFYSRFDPSGIRFVSYHFDSESEREVEDDGLVEFFEKLAG